MTEPYIGQIEIYGFNFPPLHWAFAAGQTIAIRQNTALFSLIGTLYGGNGSTTFMLPNLASRQACGSGDGSTLTPRQLGETFGDFAVTLTTDTMPTHNHGMNVYTGSSKTTVEPSSNSMLGTFATTAIYAAPDSPTQMSPMMVQPAGGNQPHNNTQPYLGLNYSIALEGAFPSFS